MDVKLVCSCLAVFCAVFFGVVTGDCTIANPERCDLKFPKVVESVKFNGTCEKPGTAKLVIGETYELDINFTPAEDAEKAESRVKAEVFGFVFPVEIENPDACINKGLKCPLKADTNYTFNAIFNLNPVYPVYSTLRAKIQWSLVDPSNGNREIFCIKIPVEVDPKPKADSDLLIPDRQREPTFRVVN